jgi:transcriptional regulator with XRE-family HTH domain
VPPPTTPETARNGIESDPTITAGVGRRIAAARRRAGLTLAVVAERSGVSVTYVSEIETGAANPTLRALDRIGGVPFGAHRSVVMSAP